MDNGRNASLTGIENLDHSKHSWSSEVFAPRWTSLRASGGVIYFGGKQSWRWNAGDKGLCTFINQG